MKLEDFPCLKHDVRFGDENLYVCVNPNGHEGDHNFIVGSELMVSLDNIGVEFEVLEQVVH